MISDKSNCRLLWNPFSFLTFILLLLAMPATLFAQSSEKAHIMVLGTAHFGNPGQDVINITFPDVFQPKYQRQVGQVLDSLAQFHPTKVALEARPAYEPELDSMYQAYLQGTHELSRNERQQLGFRLGKRFEHPEVYAIDHDGEFPFRDVLKYARKHQPEFIKYFKNVREKVKTSQDSLYSNATIREILRSKNSPENLSTQRNYYAQTAPVGADSTWVGADLVSKWHRRNIKIFGHLARITEPGDRIIVIFGAGHAPLLRYFVESSKDMKLVEPNDYL